MSERQHAAISNPTERELEGRALRACEWIHDTCRRTWVGAMNLDKWLADYSLDQLWAMNLVGAYGG